MVEVNMSYDGDLRCTATHGPSGTKFVTDAPTDNQGKGESFSPTDMVGTALATCMLTTMALYAVRHDIELKGATAKVTKEMITQPARRIGRLTVTFHIPTKVTAEQRQALENAAKQCPVHKSIHPDVQMPITFNWPNSD
jgi:putative redox protein